MLGRRCQDEHYDVAMMLCSDSRKQLTLCHSGKYYCDTKFLYTVPIPIRRFSPSNNYDSKFCTTAKPYEQVLKLLTIARRTALWVLCFPTCCETIQRKYLLVPGHKYPKMGGDHLYGRSDTHRCFVIYFFNPRFRVLMTWDK